jgi:hypothetical protein
MTRLSGLSREHHGPRAILNALERLATSYTAECAAVRKGLNIAESQLRDYQARLGVPFVHEAYVDKLTTLRDLLKAGLAGAAVDPASAPLFDETPIFARVRANDMVQRKRPLGGRVVKLTSAQRRFDIPVEARNTIKLSRITCFTRKVGH